MARPTRPAIDRFTDRFRVGDGCWDWTGFVYPNGYGSFMDQNQRTTLAHRYSYEQFVGPIPDGLQIDHLCRNRRCVRPGHLEAVTGWENRRRGESPPAVNAGRVECANGHPFDNVNTYIRPNGNRGCRICRTDARRRYEAKV